MLGPVLFACGVAGCAPAQRVEDDGAAGAGAAGAPAAAGAGSGGATMVQGVAGQGGAAGVAMSSGGRESGGGVAGTTLNVAGGGQLGAAGSAGGGAAGADGGSGAGDTAHGGRDGGRNGGSSGSGGQSTASAGAGSGAGDNTGGSGGDGGRTAAYEPCPALPEPCKIMPSGDSITVGAQSTDTGGYRVPLFHAALQNGKTITFVGPSGAGPTTVDGVPFPDAHDGHSGYFIDTIDTRKGLLPLMAGNLTKHAPHIVLLMIGTNDINTGLELATAPTRLAHVLDTVIETAPEALLVVAELIPTRTDALNDDVRSYNQATAALVAERVAAGKHLVLVDMYGAFTRNPSYKNELLFDGLHPNDAGYAVMAGVWYDAISPFLR